WPAVVGVCVRASYGGPHNERRMCERRGEVMSPSGEPWRLLIAMIAAIGKHACGQPSRSPPATTVLRLLHLIGDRAYDSDPLDEELRRRLDPVAAPNPRPLVPSPEFPGLCSTRLPRYPLQAILS